MKAVTTYKYGGPEVLRIVDMPIPEPEPGQVQIRIACSTVTSTDPFSRAGTPFVVRLVSGGLIRPKQIVHGEMLAGTVTAVGPEVERFSVGDRVYGNAGVGMGAHAEYICLGQDQALAKIPDGLDFSQAVALVDGFLTSMPFLRDGGRFRAGMRVLVNGASGSVGSMAVMLVQALGGSAVGVCSTENLELVRGLGAEEVIDYKTHDFTDPKLHDGLYDIIFDAVGKTRFAKCSHLLKEQGTYMTAGLELGAMLGLKIGGRAKKKKGQRAVFLATGLRKPADKAKDLETLSTLVAEGRLRPLIDRSFPLNEIAAAHTYVETGRKKGNVLLLMPE